MSEYMEKHTVSRLIGSPPGYVGFDQGGLLTDAIVKNPQCVLLLDEIEKAHMDLYNVLLQVMDHATLTDNQGRKADFRNVVLIMTTNAGARELGKGSVGFVEGSTKDKAGGALEKVFSPEFRNRLDAMVWFNPLPKSAIVRVVDKFIMELEQQLGERQITFDLTEAARSWMSEKGYDDRFGARPMTRVIQDHIKKPLADEILFGRLEKGGRVTVDVDAKGEDLCFRFPDRELAAPKDPDNDTGGDTGEEKEKEHVKV
jgi:ATP-dependent Clp protease ATP-binding subunit ClpA